MSKTKTKLLLKEKIETDSLKEPFGNNYPEPVVDWEG